MKLVHRIGDRIYGLCRTKSSKKKSKREKAVRPNFSSGSQSCGKSWHLKKQSTQHSPSFNNQNRAAVIRRQRENLPEREWQRKRGERGRDLQKGGTHYVVICYPICYICYMLLSCYYVITVMFVTPLGLILKDNLCFFFWVEKITFVWI